MGIENNLNFTSNYEIPKKWDYKLIDELDVLLLWFAKWENRGLERTLLYIYNDMLDTILKNKKFYHKDALGIIEVCLGKLVKDGLVHQNKEQVNINLSTNEKTLNTAYSITFEGLLFLEIEKSYANQYFEKNRIKNHGELAEKAMLVNNKWTKIGTIVAGFATSCLVIIEILKIALNNQHYPKLIEISTFFSVFLFGVCAGILILLMVLNQKK